MDKVYNILFTFPQAKAAHAQQFASVQASNIGLAVNRAFTVVRPKLKGARIREGKITFTVETGKEEE